MLKELVGLFKFVATQDGIAWALLLAVGVAYWLEIQDRKKNTVPLSWVEDQKARCDSILDNQAKMGGSISQLTELVKLALYQRKGE